ncbi:unnamed protein product [Spirodela intermedia]|uniref:Uncharacterized protein n=1 Tax=Spirodela intermedia TaxID=51605 RepID=A0A7I8JTR7_SPIIN|nr:unnamed protein product [Spirodela intermedia]CAA6673587.1 unnamed protein product [Spirodela intermedia]
MHEINLLLKQLVEDEYLVLQHQSYVICLEKFSVLFFKLLPNWNKYTVSLDSIKWNLQRAMGLAEGPENENNTGANIKNKLAAGQESVLYLIPRGESDLPSK